MASRIRKDLARNPIDRVLSLPEPTEKTEPRRETRRKKASRKQTGQRKARSSNVGPTKASTPAKPPSKRVAHTVRINAELLDECRAAVIALAGAPLRLTLSDLVESALQRELQRLKRQHNGGAEFPQYDGKLRAGRPIGT